MPKDEKQKPSLTWQKPSLTRKKYFIIDFDSTFVKHEGLEELAALALKNNPDKEKILSEIKYLTTLGMEGKIPFDESLRKRIQTLHANKNHIEKLIKLLKRKISVSIQRNKRFFKEYKDTIYILSGGFKEFISPVVTSFGIDESHIFANTFVFDKKGNVLGFDTKNLLSQENGKAKLLKSLKLNGEVVVIGDGYTDYELKKSGLAKKFVAFTENVKRDVVVKNADIIAPTFDEFLFVNKLPMSLSYPKNRIKVLLLENIDNSAVTLFEKERYAIEYFEKSMSESELIQKLNDIHILCIRSRTNLTKNVLNAASKLMTIGAYCIGTNQIDLSAASEKGIAVFNAPYSNTRSVVELALGEIIMLMRNTFDKSTKLHQGIWDKSAKNSHEVRGKTLGIIGYGNIGSQLSILAEALGMKIFFYDTVEKLALGNAQKCTTLQELLKKSDIVTIHVDDNLQNRNLIGEKEFKMMRDGVIFLNLSRGFVVDMQALVKYVKSGKIKGCGVDVFPKEPKSKDEPFVSELQRLPNVILTPHVGGSTEEAQRNIAEFVSMKIIDYINSGNTYLCVNMPNLQLPVFINSHRLLHIHKNVPGMLAQITSTLSENNINITGQYLKTSDSIGYVITDINQKYDKKVLNVLKKIPNTIRFRVLY